MSRALLANGKPIRRSQLRGLKRRGETIRVGFAPNTDRATGRLIKRRPLMADHVAEYPLGEAPTSERPTGQLIKPLPPRKKGTLTTTPIRVAVDDPDSTGDGLGGAAGTNRLPVLAEEIREAHVGVREAAKPKFSLWGPANS